MRTAYRDRRLFDYWCHEASLCHVDDLPLHRWAMRTYVERLSPARRVVGEWLAENAEFADHTVATLAAEGPLRARQLEDRSQVAWEHGHWTDEVSSRQTIARMLDKLWMQGRVGIADRVGIERRWDVFERCLPERRAGRGGRRPARRRRGGAAGDRAVGRDARGREDAAHRRPLHAPALPGNGRPGRGPDRGARAVGAAHARHRFRAPGRMVGATGRSRGRSNRSSRGGGPSPSRRSTTCSATGPGRRSCSASTIDSRSTSRRASAGGATTCCPSSMANGSSPGPTSGSTATARSRCCGCSPSTTSRDGRRRGRWSGRSPRSPLARRRARLTAVSEPSSSVSDTGAKPPRNDEGRPARAVRPSKRRAEKSFSRRS